MTEEEWRKLDLLKGRMDEALENLRYGYVKEIEKKECYIERLQERQQKVITLIKDGRFVEALKLLEKEK